MRAADLIFKEQLVDGKFTMLTHTLLFNDDQGNEFSDTFSEVRSDGHFECYQYHGEEYQFMQPLLEAIFLNKVKE